MKCKGITKIGNVCKAPATRSGYCFRHDPSIPKSKKRKASANGGRNKGLRFKGVKLFNDVTGVGDTMHIISTAIEEVHNGDITPSQANSIAYLINVGLRVREQVILESRLAKIEEKLKDGMIKYGK